MKRGQILALTIFILLSSLSIIMVLLMPINQQVIRIRKILSSIQALTYAESGLEVGNFFALKDQGVVTGYSSSAIQSNLNICNQYYQFACQKRGSNICTGSGFPASLTTCQGYLLTNNSNNEVEVYFSPITKEEVIYSFYTKVISKGSERGVERILDFDFLP